MTSPKVTAPSQKKMMILTVSVVQTLRIVHTFGVVTKTVQPRKSPYTTIITKYDVNDLPPQLRGQHYKFKIEAEQISEDEFLFRFDRAKMLNKK